MEMIYKLDKWIELNEENLFFARALISNPFFFRRWATAAPTTAANYHPGLAARLILLFSPIYRKKFQEVTVQKT